MNSELIKEACRLKDDAAIGVHSLENEIAILETESQVVSQLRFHPFENIVVVTDEHDSVSVWNWEGGNKSFISVIKIPPALG